MHVYVCVYVCTYIYICITYGTPSFSGLLFPCYLVTRSVGGINVAPSEDMGTKPFMNQYHQRIHFHWPPSPPTPMLRCNFFSFRRGGGGVHIPTLYRGGEGDIVSMRLHRVVNGEIIRWCNISSLHCVEICWFPLMFTTQKPGLKRFATPSWGGPQLGDSWGHLEPS